jgi:hypothetical protein
MADLTITAANMVPASDAVIEHGRFAGATITRGQVVYLDSADGLLKLCDANSGTAAVRQPYGIALQDVGSGQPLAVQKGGGLGFGAILTVGIWYGASATAGGIAPVSDQTTGWYPSILGYATTTGNLQMLTGGPVYSGVVRA